MLELGLRRCECNRQLAEDLRKGMQRVAGLAPLLIGKLGRPRRHRRTLAIEAIAKRSPSLTFDFAPRSSPFAVEVLTGLRRCPLHTSWNIAVAAVTVGGDTMRLKKHFSHGVAAAVLGMAALGLTAATALGLTPFYAQVGGTANSFQSGTLILSKTIGAGTPCLSSPNSAAGITTNINSACTGSDIGTGTTNSVSSSQSATVTLTNQGSIASTAGLALAA